MQSIHSWHQILLDGRFVFKMVKLDNTSHLNSWNFLPLITEPCDGAKHMLYHYSLTVYSLEHSVLSWNLTTQSHLIFGYFSSLKAYYRSNAFNNQTMIINKGTWTIAYILNWSNCWHGRLSISNIFISYTHRWNEQSDSD